LDPARTLTRPLRASAVQIVLPIGDRARDEIKRRTSDSAEKHLPEGQRPWVRAIVARAYKQTDVAIARRLLQDLARRLEDRYPSAAVSAREGLEETLTVLTLGLSDRLRQSLATTNAIESLISRTRHLKRNVKRWRGRQMVLRWTAAAVLEAVKGFRRLRGHKDMPKLVTALRARDQQLGLSKSAENVA